MPQAVAQSRVIWRHPRGRFDVIETRGTSPLGPPYAIRETVFTPERDKRGQINEPVNNKIFNSGTNKPSKPAKAHREYRPVSYTHLDVYKRQRQLCLVITSSCEAKLMKLKLHQ